MKSPFPGMDPYIEACGFWEDFHHSLITSITDSLAPLLPENYVARTGERAYVVLAESEGKEASMFQSDAGITTPASRPRTPSEPAAVAVSDPLTENDPVVMQAFIVEE